MDKNLIKVNLLPGYKEDKFISNTIYRISFAIVYLFVLYYLIFLPFIDAREKLSIAEFENTQLIYKQTYYQAKNAKRFPNPRDVIYHDTIESISSIDFPVNSWINQLNAIKIEGFILNSYEFDLEEQNVLVSVSYSSDHTLLEFEEQLWTLYWVESVEYYSAGPGSQSFTITYEVGDYFEE